MTTDENFEGELDRLAEAGDSAAEILAALQTNTLELARFLASSESLFASERQVGLELLVAAAEADHALLRSLRSPSREEPTVPPRRAARRVRARASLPFPDTGPSAVIVAGAGARGAFEAGALAVLLPRLFESLGETVLLGTSAGAVNAALWSQWATPGRPLAEVGEQVCDFWRKLDVSKVFRPLATSTAIRFFRLDWVFGRVTSLLDTTPLMRHAALTFDESAVRGNIAYGSIGGLGVVATSCPLDGSGGRSRVFLQHGPHFKPPLPDPSSAIDYEATPITYKHVLASAAIPALFPAVQVEPGGNYFCDGGVRLNTPIEPALKLGAERLAIVSSHATEYPPNTTTHEQPDIVDLGAQAVHVVLADGLIEDLRTFKRINEVVRQARAKDMTLVNELARPPRPYSDIPFAVAAPEPGKLAKLARDVFARWSLFAPTTWYRRAEYEIIRRAIAGLGRGAGNDEILSYLLFNREYAEEQIKLGREAAQRALMQLQADAVAVQAQ